MSRPNVLMDVSDIFYFLCAEAVEREVSDQVPGGGHLLLKVEGGGRSRISAGRGQKDVWVGGGELNISFRVEIPTKLLNMSKPPRR